MKIAILDDYHDSARSTRAFAALENHDVTVWTDHTENTETLAARLKDIEALILIRERTTVTSELLSRLPALKMISQRGPFPHIDVAACTARRVLLSAREYVEPSIATAELAWALILMAMRDLPRNMASLKAGKWQACVGTGIKDRTLGIFGYGRIGALVAQYGKAFGARNLIWGREGSMSRARRDKLEVAISRRQFFAESDIVTLHLPLNSFTQGIVTAEDLSSMKPTAVLVNTSRAKLIAEGCLIQALNGGRPGRFALDVFESEPLLDAGHPLLNDDRVICTPHIGYVEKDSMESQFHELFSQVKAYSSGHPINVINPDALVR